jgi:hypothetical protein
VFESIKAAEPDKVEWGEANAVEQAGRIRLVLPEGWSVERAKKSGNSSAVQLKAPAESRLVLYLGLSVKEEGMLYHYRKWFGDLAKQNGLLPGKSGTLEFDGRKWDVHSLFLVPKGRLGDKAERRVLLLALLPLNDEGTRWRSLTAICPEDECREKGLGDIIGGILVKSRFPAASGESQ